MEETTLGPVRAKERNEVVDIIRGMALFGVFAINLWYFSGLIFLKLEQQLFMASDKSVFYFVRFFFENKSITIFSMFFGLGIALQRQRMLHDTDFHYIYWRRVGALAIIGLLDVLVFIWFGDILFRYALVAVLFFFFYKDDSQALLWRSIAMLAFGIVFYLVISTYFASDIFPKTAGETVEVFRNGNFMDKARMSAYFSFRCFILNPPAASFYVVFVSLFLFGAFLGKIDFFNKIAEYQPTVVKHLYWLVPYALITNIFFTFHRMLIPAEIIAKDWYPNVRFIISETAFVAMALVYIFGVTLAFQKGAFKKVLLLFQPIGKMALTNYLMQSVLAMFVFSNMGFNQMQQQGYTFCLALAVPFFIMQMIFSKWWLSKFEYGPAEKVWRFMTYGKF